MNHSQEVKRLPGSFYLIGNCLAGLLMAGAVLFSPSTSWAQLTEGPRLSWVEEEKKGPTVVSSHEAIFEIKLFDAEGREPDRFEVWIDANRNGQYDEGSGEDRNEQISLEADLNESLVDGRVYSITLHFLESGDIRPGADPNGEQLAGTFQTKFCFYFEIDGNQVAGEDSSGLNPADPNNLLIVLAKDQDSDGDGIDDLEEGADLLPGTYWRDPDQEPTYAYNDNRLATLMTPGGEITMKIDQGRFRKVGTVVIESDPNRPTEMLSNLNFPYGFVSFRIEHIENEHITSFTDDEVELKVLFPASVSNYARFCRYHLGVWYTSLEFDPFEQEDSWRYETGVPEIERRSLILTLKDNDLAYDSVYDEEGIIEDPWGLGIPKESGKGRCFIHTIH